MEGIIYKILDYKESSYLVYLYTEYGLESLLVKGAKKYNSPYLSFCQVLNHVNYEKTNSKLPTIVSFEIINNYKNIKNSITKLKYASILLELLRQIDDYRTLKIFNFSIDILNKINEDFEPISILFIYFVKMLKPLGLLPDLNKEIIDINSRDKLEFSKLFKEAYYSKDYNLKIKKEYFIELINYYKKLDVINMNNIFKILED